MSKKSKADSCPNESPKQWVWDTSGTLGDGEEFGELFDLVNCAAAQERSGQWKNICIELQSYEEYGDRVNQFCIRFQREETEPEARQRLEKEEQHRALQKTQEIEERVLYEKLKAKYDPVVPADRDFFKKKA